MKITRIRCYAPPKSNPTFNQSNFLATVETDAGITGIGEGGTRDTLEQCAGVLIGQDPTRIEYLWQFLYRGYFYPAGREKLHALGALDMALWDIKGKALGVPVYQLLGGLTRSYIECYSTGFPPHGSLGETAHTCLAAGFRAFRTAVADSGNGIFDARRMVDQTLVNCQEIREGIGPTGDWAIDFHTRLDLADAIHCADLIRELNPLFVEDPLRSENPAALAAFRAQARVPVAVGEQFGDRWDINELIERHLLDYARVTLPNVGGITEMVKIAALCETHYIGLVPHFTGPVSLAALVHVLATFSGPAIQEVVGTGPTPSPTIFTGCDFHDGKLWPNARPGLGVEFDTEQAQLVAEITEPYAPIPVFHRPDGSLTNW
ncbi:MAG: mandelate racemase/muconate lactonizing enzyme family protein [Abitibacteriaceae bacterium]|nr:mandelate racemase/muconate lactonizing enzyme family protein [Abditibacteriaceae bacterium]